MNYKEYEKLTAKIVDRLAKLRGIEGSRVSHNVQVVGLTGASHQIDVLWQFEIGPISYRVLFQAKNWKDPVDLPAVHTFSGVLRDIADAKGVMVTRSGYDEGNIGKVAKGFGIELIVLDEYGNIEGVQRPGLSAKAFVTPVNIGIANFKFASSQQAQAFRVHADSVPRDSIEFYTKTGKQFLIKDITDMIYKHAFENRLDNDGEKLIYTPDESFFVQVSPEIESEILTVYAIVSKKQPELLGEASLLITHVLQKVTGDQTFFVDDSFNVHRKERLELNLNYSDPADRSKTLTTVFGVEDRRGR